MQCYPNSSATLIRSIIKQRNPRLECPVAEDWGNQCSMQEQPQAPPCIPQCLTGMTEGSHSHTPLQHFYKHQRFLLPKNVLSGPFLCLLGELAVPGSWSLGSSNAVSGWNSGTGQICVAWAVGCIYLGLKTTGTIPVSSSQLGTILHISTGKKKARKCQRASTTAKEL